MSHHYFLEDTAELLSPALVVFREHVERNIDVMIRLAGSPTALRPHCKTHKMPAVTRLELERGIAKHKAATFGEAEMLARVGAKDILLAYPLVGPNIRRAVQFREAFPDVQLLALADDAMSMAALGQAMHARGLTQPVLLDVNTGMNRTGVAISPEAEALYGRLANTPGLDCGGLHCYDGHNAAAALAEREAMVATTWKQVTPFVARLEAQGWQVPRLVCGGTGSLLPFCRLNDPRIEQSAGTTVLHDTGYGDLFADLQELVPAALILTRVISRPGPNLITLDAGHKSASPDQPLGRRLTLIDLPDAKTILHNEEHWTVETPHAHRYQPGHALLAIPRHVCTATYLHPWAYVVAGGRVVDRWDIGARDRQRVI